ncbi:MAG: flagellar type III secretion system pore protein FliP [Aquificae bacterium]|nr:flagellar type III secretion system pore protein FliP [Aquificota bacterium]
MRSVLTTVLLLELAFAQIPSLEVRIGEGDLVDSVRLLLLLTLLSLAPSLLIMFTSFVRIVVVLSVLRQAIGLPQVPPNQVIISLALFLTFFIMKPVIDSINGEALQPYIKKEISDEEFFRRVESRIKEFMVKHTRKETLEAFLEVAKIKKEELRSPEDLPLRVVIPAFMVSELKTAFEIVFLLYIPFLIIDMVVASILISMGIIMIPPQLISLPFKIMLFVLANGWELVVLSLVRSYS